MNYTLKISFDYLTNDFSQGRRGGLMHLGNDLDEANRLVETIKGFIGEKQIKKLNYEFEAIKEEAEDDLQ